MRDTCQRIADEAHESFIQAREKLSKDAERRGHNGSERHRSLVDDERKDHFKDGLTTMTQRVLTEAGKVTDEGITAIRIGGQSLLDQLIAALEIELTVMQAYPGALGPARHPAAVDSMREKLDAILDSAIDDAKKGFAGGQPVFAKGIPWPIRWLEGVGINLTASLIWAGISAGVALIFAFVFWLLS